MAYFSLPEGGQNSAGVQGEFIHVARADGPFLLTYITTDGQHASFPLSVGDQLQIPGGLREVNVTNRHPGQNDIELTLGWGLYTPRQRGEAVQITGQSAPLQVTHAGQPVPVTGDLSLSGPLETVQQVPTGGLAGQALQPGAGVTIPANIQREEIILKADADNAGAVTYAGIPLDAGERVALRTRAAVHLSAAAGDTVHVLELT